MPYQHGIYVKIGPTVMPVATVAANGVQCVVGTAPVNLLANPAAAVNTPILMNNITDAETMLGYSDQLDLDAYTIGQAIHATFEIFNTSPLVAINVLDPTKHTTPKTSNGALVAGQFTPGQTVGSVFTPDIGILLATLAVKNSTGTITYVLGTDYTAAFNADGSLTITRVVGGAITTATASIETVYSILDPTLVTDEDIVAGIALINRVFQAVDVIPEILIAPGWSQMPTVGAALIAACPQVSTVFKASTVLDIDCSDEVLGVTGLFPQVYVETNIDSIIDAAIAWKTTNSYISRDAIVCFLKAQTNQGKIVWMSAMEAARMQASDAANESTPFVSPSNQAFNILAAVLGDGVTQILLTLDEANALNAEGICTALKFQGWRSWGNYTSYYSYAAEQDGTVYQPQDVFINVKRGFDWQGNHFITAYWSKVDNPGNYRLIQTIVTDENQFYNPFITAGQVAGMNLQFNMADNPIAQLLKGILKIRQSMAPYLPAQVIQNTLQYDVSLLLAAMGGGS
jgi:phage tail sheath protein FI